MHAVPGSSFRPLTATKVIKQLTVKQHAILLYCTNTKEESMSWLYRGYNKPKDSPSPRATSPLARVHQNHTATNSNKSNHLLPQEKGQPLPPPSSLFEDELFENAEHKENLDSEGNSNSSNNKNTKKKVSFHRMSDLHRFVIEPGRENEFWTDSDKERFKHRHENFPPTPESPADYSNRLEHMLHDGVLAGVAIAAKNALNHQRELEVPMPPHLRGEKLKETEAAVACANEHWCTIYGNTDEDNNTNDDSSNDGRNLNVVEEPYPGFYNKCNILTDDEYDDLLENAQPFHRETANKDDHYFADIGGFRVVIRNYKLLLCQSSYKNVIERFWVAYAKTTENANIKKKSPYFRTIFNSKCNNSANTELFDVMIRILPNAKACKSPLFSNVAVPEVKKLWDQLGAAPLPNMEERRLQFEEKKFEQVCYCSTCLCQTK